ncbi:hypothetical protein SARC_09757 [Sphaeroforma arctica JP610]|uniref:NADH dehydrogenase [ubiquinone] flavoprotein 2, mitochondrial n=1 Tax=Sphaeroforma arctica JP610 TaxID=667725 RepID=A0A0L0FLY9_9EUKA|nr:hypothetical protein SARC_09757 [Sphaeroforma arctica JP610]KNC77794.1 hypothetical protein SARC_09757 [Sphaeroforma arctica JP610]|eukprot:XP_014151696.1 hypothetical protein SARC_09757 [Sphaeroforma arctica JP610]
MFRAIVSAARPCASVLAQRTLTRTMKTSTALRSDKLFVHRDSEQNNKDTPFEFTDENLARCKSIMQNYPRGHQSAAMIPLLDLAQRQHGWLPLNAMKAVAKLLNVGDMRVFEVATFYTMFNRDPIGKKFVQVCTTSPCQLRGCNDILKTCEDTLGIKVGETSKDGEFTLVEVECAGACVNAPLFAVNDTYYEDLTPETAEKVLKAFQKGETPKAGPQNGRKGCENSAGLTALTTPPPGPGFMVREDL